MKNRFILGLIILVALLLRVWAADLDPFLHEWDERFHALVARNFMEHPFVPLLHKIANNTYDPNVWCCNHIWLHKQPLFMWQMALSMQMFGVSEFTMRLPSVVMGTIMVWLVYRIAILGTGDKTTAIMSSIMLAFSSFQLKLIGGMMGMDHNDVALGFYVLASFWAYSEYTVSKKRYWVLLIGLFAGAANSGHLVVI